jgi:hypothetical protein
MRRVALLVAWILLAGGLAAQRVAEPFMPVAAEYRLPATATRELIARDYQDILRLGYNTVVLVVRWLDSEPERGQYRFDALTHALELAQPTGLRVVLQLEAGVPPPWALTRYPDGRLLLPARAGSGDEVRGCLDHPYLRGDALAFVAAAARRVASARSVLAIDIASDLAPEFCLCPHTQRRFEMWSKQAASSDRAAYVRAAARDDLRQLAETTANVGYRPVISHTRKPSILQGIGDAPGQDDWQMASAVDAYGGSQDASPYSSLRPLLAFAGLASATHDKGWWLRSLPLERAESARLVGWSAVARGAKGLVVADWRQAPEFVPLIARNPGLFLPLRPRPARVAILHDRRGNDQPALERVQRALLSQNVAADVISADELDAATAGRYRLFVRAAPGSMTTRASEIVKSAKATVVEAAREPMSPAQIVETVTRAGAVPDVRLEGSNGLIETRFLESPTVLMLVALNHGDDSQKVTMTFPPETQEAVWVNLETGTGVNFVAGGNGPTYAYWFRPRDALVLMIRKDVR